MVLKRGWWVLALVIAGCAQVREIGGGDKDNTPPQLMSAAPSDLSTNFTADRIVLRFDERIQLDRPKERLLVSPPLDPPPTMRISGPREVTIALNGPLESGTTYTFTVGEAVKDLTEGNAAAGLSYVLSTGAAIDSLSLAGQAVNAFSGKPEVNLLVMLYAAGDSAAFRTGRPAYVTRTDKEGNYRLEHLPRKRFQLRALRDQNANYRYDLPNEEVAFADAAIDLDAPDTVPPPPVLRLFQEVPARQLIRESRVMADGAVRIVLARPARQINVEDVARSGGVLTWNPEWNDRMDTVLLWPSDTAQVSAGRYAISTEEGPLDTIGYRPLTPMPFHLGVNARLVEAGDTARVLLMAERPVKDWDVERMTLSMDIVPLPFGFSKREGSDREASLTALIPEGRSVNLQLLPKAVRDIYGGTNDTLAVRMGRAEASSTGTLRIKLTPPLGASGPFILELLDQQGGLVRSQRLQAPALDVVWDRLRPGLHQLRLIADDNDNGRWDTGDLARERQPERVWPYTGTVNVRAAWDLGLEWDLK